ncbi:MAG: hypothetical protein ACR2GF_03005 [Acidimicrobiales bacterium]
MSETTRKHPATKRYPPELRERAVRMVAETIDQTGDSFGVVTRIDSTAATARVLDLSLVTKDTSFLDLWVPKI